MRIMAVKVREKLKGSGGGGFFVHHKVIRKSKIFSPEWHDQPNQDGMCSQG